MKRSELVNVAKELSPLLFNGEGADPSIDTTLPAQKLGEQILEASELIQKKDELTPTTTKTLKALFLEELDYLDGKKMIDEEEKEWSVTDYFIHLGLLEDVVIPEDDETLVGFVINAETMRELKDLAKSYDEFKPIRGMVTKYKTIAELRKAMMELLEEEVVETVEVVKEEVPEEPKKSEPKPKMEVVKEEEKEPAKKVEEKKIVKTKTVDFKYTRIDSICEALKSKNPKSIQSLIEISNAIYIEKGGSDNLIESRTMANYVIKTLIHFEINVPQK